MKKLFAAVLLASACTCLAVQSHAQTTYKWYFTQEHPGLLSSTQSFHGYSGAFGVGQIASPTEVITAKGFTTGGTAKALYTKNEGAGETGLGLNEDAGADHEIDPAHFVQMDISGLFTNPNYKNLKFSIGSVQNTEGFIVYGSNTSGSLAGAVQLMNFIAGPSDPVDVPFDASASFNSHLYKYYDVQGQGSTQANVLVDDSLQVTLVPPPVAAVPEFRSVLSLGMLLMAGGGGIWLRRRRV